MFTCTFIREHNLVIECRNTEPVHLPWDLLTVFDCALKYDDIVLLESGGVVEIGEIQMHLELVN